jgi:hypothetical protein
VGDDAWPNLHSLEAPELSKFLFMTRDVGDNDDGLGMSL